MQCATTMGLALHSQTKTAIYNVYKFFRDRKWDQSRGHRDDINLYKRVAAAVGVSHRSVMRIANEGDRLQATYGVVVFEDPLNRRRQEVDLDTAIRDKFLDFIRRKETPTVNKIRIELLDDGVLLCSYDYMKLQLKRLGYRFRPARPRRIKQKVRAVKVERDAEGGGGGGAGSSDGLQLEHVTVKMEPLEPGHHYADGDVPPPLVVTTSSSTRRNDLECDVHIKVEQHEYNDHE